MAVWAVNRVSKINAWVYKTYQFFWVGIDLLFPPSCAGCGAPGTRWCKNCQEKVRELSLPLCDVCGLPVSGNQLCLQCSKKCPSFKMLRSWAEFEDPVKEALHRLKYRRDIGLGEALADQMVDFVRMLGWPIDVVIPIPLSKLRFAERGYNQVATVAWPLSMKLNLDYAPGALTRTRETRSQVGLTADERHENVKNAFHADTVVGERVVLLMDDVSTTGATLSSGAEALYSSGARDVYALTIARALPHQSLKIV